MPYQGMQFRTPEHFYQAMKTTDVKIRRQIADLPTPGQAKRFGRSVQFRPDWDEIKLNVMEYALCYKFSDESFQYKLTQQSLPIIETNLWHDNFWGNCLCSKCKNVPGQNHLGKLLEKIKEGLS